MNKIKSENKNIVIYMITVLTTNKSYIGITNNIKRRFSQHKHYAKNQKKQKNSTFYIDWFKAGLDDVKLDILEYLPNNMSEIYMYKREAYYIEKYDTVGSGYNIANYRSGVPGINKGRKLTVEQRHKVSENHADMKGYKNVSAKYYIIEDSLGNINKYITRKEIANKLNLSFKQVKQLISKTSGKDNIWYKPKATPNIQYRVLESDFINYYRNKS